MKWKGKRRVGGNVIILKRLKEIQLSLSLLLAKICDAILLNEFRNALTAMLHVLHTHFSHGGDTQKSGKHCATLVQLISLAIYKVGANLG